MASLNHVLQGIITRKYKFCCLCFNEIQHKPVSVHDEIVLKEGDHESAIKITDVLSFVLGHDTCNAVSAFEFLCKQCTQSAVSSYKFISTSKGNSELLCKAVCNLNACFENIAQVNYDFKSIFVTFDTMNLTTQEYYDTKHPITTPSSALKRFQSIINVPEPKLKVKTEAVKKEKFKKFKPDIPRKRREYYSLRIKTRDMIYDKNDTINIKCKVCYKSYPSLSNLRNHFIRVHAPKDYKCSICDRKFGSIAILEAHKSESHITLVCSECGKTFRNRHTLKMHEIGHQMKIVCQDCGRVYKSQTTFKKHRDLNICQQQTRASPADAKYTCDHCNKKYTQKVSLRVHIQYEHGNYKSHECKWCKKKFWAQSRLKAHIVKHTQEKNFTCNICGGKFVSKESLLYHTRTHTGEKPYKCKICDARFLSASRRADHIKRQHSDVIFQCNICNAKYTTEICLEKHKKTHERSDKEPVHLQISDRIHLTEEDEIFLELSDNEVYNIPRHIV